MLSLPDILPLSRYLTRLFAARPGLADEVAAAWQIGRASCRERVYVLV